VRPALLWNPRLLCERLAVASVERRRLGRLRGTLAGGLSPGHIDSLELLDIAKRVGIEVIYDIGANVGTWTLLATSLIPEAALEAFEPLPAHVEHFDKICGRLPGIRLHPVALGSENGTARLRVTNFSDSSSILPVAWAGHEQFGLKESGSVPVAIRRLDDYRAERVLALPDLIKLDVQGYELEVLKGAPDCVAHSKAVLAEVSFIEYYERQCLFHDIVAFLAGFGLHCAAMGHSTPTGRPLGQTDVLFIRSGLLR